MVSTVFGNIDFVDVQAPFLKLESVSENINLRYEAKELIVETISGNVEFYTAVSYDSKMKIFCISGGY